MNQFIKAKILGNKWLLVILILAAVLRLWSLGSIPPHLTNDEAALGYNAYSILKTGRDEHGEFLPIIFKSFSDWKPGLYVYAAVPSVAVFGLNEFAARLPGAISGIIAVWLIYLVVGELFREKNQLKIENYKLKILASFLLAISPWHIHFSRGAWEAGMSLTLTLIGIYFFLRAIRDRPNWLLFSALFFGTTLITYQGAKLATGLVILGLVVFWSRKLFTVSKKILVGSVVAFILVSLPVLLSIGTEKTGRLEVFSVFSGPRPEEIVSHILGQGNETKESLTYILFHNEILHFKRGILGRWMNHYSPRFLFFEGDWVHLNLSVPRAGVLLFIDIVFLVAGTIFLARMKISPAILFIGYWLLVAPLPAALSRDTLHAIRSLNLVIPLTIVLGAGALFLWHWVRSLKWSKFAVFLFSVLYSLNFLYFIDQYFVHMNAHNAKSWQYGYKQIVEKITPLQKSYEKIVITQSYDQPYIYFLFYQKYNPSLYQKNVKLVEGPAGKLDAWLVPQLDNISFEFLDWHRDRGRKGVLFVGTIEQIPIEDSNNPDQFKLVDEIKYPNGQTAFRLVEVL
mgnify:CR=1 FL=1